MNFSAEPVSIDLQDVVNVSELAGATLVLSNYSDERAREIPLHLSRVELRGWEGMLYVSHSRSDPSPEQGI